MFPSQASFSLRQEIESVPWYHTLDLPDGGLTKGMFDLRGLPRRVLPDDLRGKRCLDACTASGFWAFEMERRGADEVVAIDIKSLTDQDWQIESAAPTVAETQRDSFDVARRALGSSVVRQDLSVYDVLPQAVGTFDFIFMGAVLLHLRDPVKALRALRTVLRPTGELRSLDVVLLWSSVLRPSTPRGRLDLGDGPRWWTPNARGHRRWMEAAGFEVAETDRFIFERFGPSMHQATIKGLKPRTRARHLLYCHVGVPCQLAICR